MPTSALLSARRRQFLNSLISDGLFTFIEKRKQGLARRLPSIADGDNKDSIAITSHVFEALGVASTSLALSPQALGARFQQLCREFIADTFLPLRHLRPGSWEVTTVSSRGRLELAGFQQYSHLQAVADACAKNLELSAALGREYLIAPDVVILRQPEPDSNINSRALRVVDDENALRTGLRLLNNKLPLLHASISCKVTMRSDRAQNSRSEALNLIRNRKGRVPHIVVVTAEPLPSRLASLALGTGDLDCVYHTNLLELIAAVNEVAGDDSKELLRIMNDGKRLRDIADLPLDLAV